MSLQKHILENPNTIVTDALEGLCLLNHQLALDAPNKIVYRFKVDKSKVALICGGGSGHEPAHASFVGQGILSAAVCGSVFASPNASQVRRGIDLVDNDKGTLIIVKNYTGDALNFGLAKEQYAALHPSKANRVKFLTVGDDVAVGKSQGSIVGRRGLAGIVLTYKIAGALAEKGASLDEVYGVAEYVATRLATIGVGLDHCHVPGTATHDGHLSADELEIGMGIHNESGNSRLSPIPPLSQLLPQLLDLLTKTDDPERGFVPFKNDGSDEVVLLVNNLGGLSELELTGVVGATGKALRERKINVKRVLSGTFMTSLNMPGFSITLLLLPKPNDNAPVSAQTLLELVDAPAQTPGWKWSSPVPPTPPDSVKAPASSAEVVASGEGSGLKAPDPKAFISAIERACQAVIRDEPEITRMDTIAGDGDCGLTLKAGVEGIQEAIKAGEITGNDIVKDVVRIAKVAEERMGGTSGALYSIFFSGLAQALHDKKTYNDATWTGSLSSALKKLYTYTRARPPSRTLIDPLAAFITSLPSDPAGNDGAFWKSSVTEAAKAAENTRNLQAKAGRSAYVEGARLEKENVPDPGAWGVKTILEALVQ